MKRRTRINVIVLSVLFVVFAVSWFTGGIGLAARKLILPRFAPRKIGSSFMIYSFGKNERFDHQTRGITLMMSPRRARDILRGAFPVAGRYVPPGLLGDGFRGQCMWLPHGEKDSSMGMIPIWLVIDASAGYEPVLKGRMPVDEFNKYVVADMDESLSSREEWIFGHYDLIYQIDFTDMRILSDTGVDLGENRRKLRLYADGRVRIKFDDDPISARTTAKVKELTAEIDMTFIPRDDKYALAYEAKVTELRLNVNNMLKWGDKKVAEKLRKSLEKSLNRKKNKERGMKLRIPEWAARDMIIDIQLSESQE
jgi:hypothetical protein